MGTGKSGLSGRSGTMATSVVVQSGDTVDLSEFPLIYGKSDSAISGALRLALEAQEEKRLKAKTEYAIVTDDNGNIIGKEMHGGKGSVRIPEWDLMRSSVLTHNHPRGTGQEGELGGTFSPADLTTFSVRNNLKTIRASAAEGTYSITKDKNFDIKAFNGYVNSVNAKRAAALKTESKKIVNKVKNGTLEYNDYKKESTKLFNQYLVALHNDYIAGQKEYGYKYTLERRK